MVIGMVNANKHKQIQAKIGMLPFEDVEFMNKWCAKVIHDTNENPQKTLDGLKMLYIELDSYYETLSRSVGGVLKIGNCERIIEIYEHVLVTKEIIQNNYHVLRIESDMIKSILSECDRILNEFKNIQERQNKNIDKKGYGGLTSILLVESMHDKKLMDLLVNDEIPKDLENVLRLKESINLVGLQR